MEINKIIKTYLVSKGYNEKEIFLNARPARECISIFATAGGEPRNGLTFPQIQVNVKRKDGAYEEILRIVNLLHNLNSVRVDEVLIRYCGAMQNPYKLTEEDGCFVYSCNFRLIL
ncbi:minor capsid protein [Brevibacillus agri]|uniref:minor capsid protein n=1 Tax=Brevibacillus agri TaxID=51101 RepID=UPI0025B63ECE|nr:minor capsid protein [Brevibacillus agri]MDN4094348.1 minor capsid protein [Brevibacillus agri]